MAIYAHKFRLAFAVSLIGISTRGTFAAIPEPNGRGLRDLVGVFVVAVFRVRVRQKKQPATNRLLFALYLGGTDGENQVGSRTDSRRKDGDVLHPQFVPTHAY